MKVRDILAEMSDEFLELDAASLVMIAATPARPMVWSTVPPDMSKKLLELIVNHGDWSDTVKHEDKVH